jgi:6-pyruvoyl-tetrahydropterin synthase
VQIEITTSHLKDGMVVDFHALRDIIDQVDHTDINQTIEYPTAEHVALWIAREIYQLARHCHLIRVDVEESAGSFISYEVSVAELASRE